MYIITKRKSLHDRARILNHLRTEGLLFFTNLEHKCAGSDKLGAGWAYNLFSSHNIIPEVISTTTKWLFCYFLINTIKQTANC